jgi:hypothetical protein
MEYSFIYKSFGIFVIKEWRTRQILEKQIKIKDFLRESRNNMIFRNPKKSKIFGF